MKTHIISATRTLAATLILAALISFDKAPGGESFSIMLGERVLVNEHVTGEEKIRTIALSEADASETLKIHYNHCGKVGTARTLTLRDKQQNSIRTFSFSDNKKGEDPFMKLAVKELLSLQKGVFQVVYSSNEMSKGKVLATFTTAEVKAGR